MTAVHKRSTAHRAEVNRRCPHQVAIPSDLCTMENFSRIMAFCAAQGWVPMPPTLEVDATWPCGRQITYRLHCFATPAEAEIFRAAFGGEPFDPKRDREGGRALGAWRRAGRFEDDAYAGPLPVPRFFRENP